MKKEELKKNGTKLCERDLHRDGCYAGTNDYYLLNNQLYSIEEVDNSMHYNGTNTINCLHQDVKSEIKGTTDLYWCVDMGLSVEGYHKLCEIYGVEPSTKYNI